MKKTFKITLAIIFLSVFVLLSLKYIITIYEPEEEIKEKEEVEGTDIVISANIKLQSISLIVYPEKRFPPSGNWSTIIDFIVRNSYDTLIFQKNLATNNLGHGTINLTPAENIPNGNHTVYIKGISHLTKRYNNIPFNNQHENFDFTPYGDLLAGETNIANDDYINSLDISTLINNLATGDYINDLNQDSIVNSMDLSIQLNNLYDVGDA